MLAGPMGITVTSAALLHCRCDSRALLMVNPSNSWPRIHTNVFVGQFKALPTQGYGTTGKSI